MSYSSLGAHYEPKVAGIPIPVDVPLDEIAKDAIAAAIPAIEEKIPELVAKAIPAATRSAINSALPKVREALAPDLRMAALLAGVHLTVMVGAIVLAARWVKKS
jgi:hypothetical protein